jgi:hypothetical protein
MNRASRPRTAHAWETGQAVGRGAVIDRFADRGFALGESAVGAIALGGGAAAIATLVPLVGFVWVVAYLYWGIRGRR